MISSILTTRYLLEPLKDMCAKTRSKLHPPTTLARSRGLLAHLNTILNRDLRDWVLKYLIHINQNHTIETLEGYTFRAHTFRMVKLLALSSLMGLMCSSAFASEGMSLIERRARVGSNINTPRLVIPQPQSNPETA